MSKTICCPKCCCKCRPETISESDLSTLCGWLFDNDPVERNNLCCCWRLSWGFGGGTEECCCLDVALDIEAYIQEIAESGSPSLRIRVISEDKDSSNLTTILDQTLTEVSSGNWHFDLECVCTGSRIYLVVDKSDAVLDWHAQISGTASNARWAEGCHKHGYHDIRCHDEVYGEPEW